MHEIEKEGYMHEQKSLNINQYVLTKHKHLFSIVLITRKLTNQGKASSKWQDNLVGKSTAIEIIFEETDHAPILR